MTTSKANPVVVDMATEVDQLHSRTKSLADQFGRGGGSDCIEGVTDLACRALELCSSGHSKRSVPLTKLSIHLDTRCSQLGGIENINEAIALDREALLLGLYIFTRHKRLGALDDLDGAIMFGHDVLLPPGHLDRSSSLDNLGVCFSTRYDRLGALDDLDEAVMLDRDMFPLRPPGHPDQSSSLNNLGLYLFARYNRLGALGDLDEAIMLSCSALSFSPPGLLFDPIYCTLE